GSGLQGGARMTAAEAGPRRARILMVDDRPENLMALEAILEQMDVDLVRAHSGEEALRQVLLHDFAVILLDVQMPGMNGFETAQLIKSRERSSLTPIIFLTAISKDEEFVYEGYSVGAVDYISKPFNPDILRSKVGVLVDLYLKTEQLQEQEQRLRESERRELELRHRSELLESEARMAEIVSSAMEAIITFDDLRRITLFNAAAERMFGVPVDAALGRPIGDFFHPEPGAELDRICAEAASVSTARSGDPTAEPPHSRALTGIRAGGEEFPVEASISCLALPAEKVFTVIARDVSERRRAEEALRQQAESLANTTAELKLVNEQLQLRQRELEAAMSARSRFYASMSHELRTPINAILGYSALLLDNIYGPLTPEQANGIERAHKAAKHLLELVNDILDLSKIEAGKVEMEIQPTVFPTLVQDLFVTVRPLADEHGSELTLEADPEPVTIVSDPRRVRQILLNLLSNAIKFGEGKPITVACRTREDGGVEVDVVDRGTGIASDDVEKIFDEFVQLSQPNQQQGTGLGLPISRRLARLLGGSLEVESIPGEGSTFRLSLPPRVVEPPLLAVEDELVSAAFHGG
ncbi:MAG TPA: ATP-binding protein, partial [Longimicrobiaceae bacterium]|nr:ATP-binding protein [Longimicrobiaceae bacterium]